jgi:hypothetical protein
LVLMVLLVLVLMVLLLVVLVVRGLAALGVRFGLLPLPSHPALLLQAIEGQIQW